MILWDWYITNERLGIACLTNTSVITFRAMRKIKSSSNKAMVSYGISSASRKGVSRSQFRKGYENNRSAVSSWKSPFDWSRRMNTCLTVLRFQFHPRKHGLPYDVIYHRHLTYEPVDIEHRNPFLVENRVLCTLGYKKNLWIFPTWKKWFRWSI